MPDFLLIHGGWGGGWQWKETALHLAARGHRVVTPTLTGLGDRTHLATPEVNLSLHLEDIRNTIRFEELENFILVGFSYGGMVATGIAAEEAFSIDKLIYLDAFVPLPGESLFELFGPEITKSLKNITDGFGEGWRIPFFDTYDPRLTDQPIGTGRQKLHFSREVIDSRENCYIECTRKDPEWSFSTILTGIAERYRKRGGTCIPFEADHFPMHSCPEKLAELLHSLSLKPCKEYV